MSTTYTIYPDGDTYVREDTASTNYSSSTILSAGLSGSSKRQMLFKFDVSGYNPTDISSANFTLKLFREAGASSHTMTIARIAHDFVMAECTWDIASNATAGFDWDGAAQFALTDEPTYTIEVGNGETDQVVDIKELVIDAINRRSGALNFIVCFLVTDSPSGTGNSTFYSVNHGTVGYRPKLEVVIADRIVWDGVVNSDADNNLNWLGGSLPTSTDYALFTGTPSNDILTGTLACDRAYVSKSYKKNIGASDTLLTINTNEFHLSSPHAEVYANLNNAASSNTDLRIKDTNAKAGSIIFDGKYDATINRTRSDISLLTDDVTLINALTRLATFTCDNDVTTIRLGGASATLEDGGGAVTMVNGSTLLCFSDDNEDTNFNVFNSILKLQAHTVDTITLYSGVVTFRGNTGAPFSAGAYIYSGMFNTRTDSSNFSATGTIRVYGGRFLTDADTNAAPA